MNLVHRTTKLEELAQSHAIRREWDSFWAWLRGLSREEGIAFTEFCLPTFVELGIAPAYTVLPSQMSIEERRAYAEEWERMIVGFGRGSANEEMFNHRTVIDLWRRFVQHPSHGSRSQQVA